MKKAFALLLSAAVMLGSVTTGALAATLQSNQASYQLSQDPVGTQPFSYSATQSHSATLVPVGTSVQSDSGGLLLIEVFVYQEEGAHWTQDTTLFQQSALTIRDGTHIYHVSTQDPSAQAGSALDRGIWLKGAEGGSVQPTAITGEPVDEWALDLVNQAVAADLLPTHLKGQDLRESITRIQFASLAVRLYEAMSGQTAAAPAENPFTDTSDPEVLKAYALGITAGLTDATFGPSTLLTREQAAAMLSAVYRKLGGEIPAAGALSFSDSASVSSWARDSVAFMAQHGILAGYTDGRFAPRDHAQRQACLIMALRMRQNLTVSPAQASESN